MSLQIEGITAKGQLVPLYFTQDAVAASQTDARLFVGEYGTGVTAVNEYTMPFGGEIVAVSHELSAAASAGSMTVGADVNGTEDADSTYTVTTSSAGYKRVSRGKAQFAAGDRIGAEITTDGSWNATTADLLVVVWVLLYLEEV